MCRQAQDSKQDTTESGRNSGKGKEGEVKTRATIPAKHIPCRNDETGSQNELYLANENMGDEELHWGSRHDAVRITQIAYAKDDML